jgi:hypothetical protein
MSPPHNASHDAYRDDAGGFDANKDYNVGPPPSTGIVPSNVELSQLKVV